MKLTIIPSDGTVYVDGRAYGNIDMGWVPNIEGKTVHAVQWLESEGEVEFVGPYDNLKITELGVFEQAIGMWNEKKEEDDALQQQRLEEEERLRKEMEERLQAQFIETNNSNSDVEEEDEDLFYDIEELLKEI